MKTEWLAERIAYDGAQLRAHWILRRTGMVGDALVAFRGPCCVAADEMADLADLMDGPGIAGDDMVHFLWESFGEGDLLRAILQQRLLAATAREVLETQRSLLGPRLRRSGDDLYLGEGKLSISIATRSLVSTLIHFAVNVTNSGVPVRSAALVDLGVEPEPFARALLQRVQEEQASVAVARAKVRGKDEA